MDCLNPTDDFLTCAQRERFKKSPDFGSHSLGMRSGEGQVAGLASPPLLDDTGGKYTRHATMSHALILNDFSGDLF